MADSLRIRFDGNRYRGTSIEKAAHFYDMNKSDAVAHACEDVVKIKPDVSRTADIEELDAMVEDSDRE